MKRKFLYILCLLVLILPSCKDKTDTTVTTSSETAVTSFYFSAQDSFPAIGNATFTISHYAATDTGLITNPDSMTYLTPVDGLVPHLLFKATPASAVIIKPDTSFALTGKDTIDFTHPVLLRVTSSDKTAIKYYRIVVNVHQVDPNMFRWKRLNGAVLGDASASTRALRYGSSFYLFANDGFKNIVYRSADGTSWDNGSNTTGLPDNCHVREIIAGDDAFYYCQQGMVYSSADGLTWTEEDLSAETVVPQVTLMHFNDSVWLVGKNDAEGTFHLIVKDNGTWRALADTLPHNWPMTDFAAVEFVASSLRHRAMIVGGYDTEGNGLNSRWNIEYTPANGYRYANFAIERPLCSAILGAAVVHYGNMFYLFGGVDAEAQYVTQTALYSEDEGLNWLPIDTAHNQLMHVYSPRTQTSALTHDNSIYLFGGQTRTEIFSDVMQGQLTSIDW